MRRPFRHRAVAAVMAVWFAFVLAEPAALHSCPMHGGAIHGGAMHARAAHPGATHDPAVQAAMEHGAHHAPEHPARGHQCTCLGHCTSTVGAAAPSAVVALVPVVETAATRDRGLPDFEYVPVAAAHVLPFANGPPTTVA